MNKTIIFLFFYSFAFAATSQDLYDLNNSKKYALHLYKTKEYKKAAVEFERICFLDSADWQSKLLLLSSYRKDKNYNLSINLYKNIEANVPYYKKNIFKNEYNKSLFNYDFKNFISDDTLGQSDSNFFYFKIPSLLLSNKWKLSEKYFEKINFKTENTFAEYHKNYLNLKNIKYKKPWFAAVSSAIIPGTGKVYTGKYKDGIMAFLFTGLSAYQSYRGYQSKGVKSGIFIIYSGITAGFYLGNIYGSYKSAIQKNKHYRKKIDKNINDIFFLWAE